MVEEIIRFVMDNYDFAANFTGGDSSKEQWNLEGRKQVDIECLIHKEFKEVDAQIRDEAYKKLVADYGDVWVKKF